MATSLDIHYRNLISGYRKVALCRDFNLLLKPRSTFQKGSHSFFLDKEKEIKMKEDSTKGERVKEVFMCVCERENWFAYFKVKFQIDFPHYNAKR